VRPKKLQFTAAMFLAGSRQHGGIGRAPGTLEEGLEERLVAIGAETAGELEYIGEWLLIRTAAVVSPATTI
jgi:hypothetical protein